MIRWIPPQFIVWVPNPALLTQTVFLIQPDIWLMEPYMVAPVVREGAMHFPEGMSVICV